MCRGMLLIVPGKWLCQSVCVLCTVVVDYQVYKAVFIKQYKRVNHTVMNGFYRGLLNITNLEPTNCCSDDSDGRTTSQYFHT